MYTWLPSLYILYYNYLYLYIHKYIYIYSLLLLLLARDVLIATGLLGELLLDCYIISTCAHNNKTHLDH